MTTPIKIAVATVSVGGVAVGSGFGIHYLTKEKTVQPTISTNKNKALPEDNPAPSNPVTISSLLSKDKLKLLGSENGDDQKWLDSWGKFKQAYPNEEPKEPWKFTNWTQDKAGQGVPQEFKTRCSENSQKSVPNENDDLYTNLKKYCTKSSERQA